MRVIVASLGELALDAANRRGGIKFATLEGLKAGWQSVSGPERAIVSSVLRLWPWTGISRGNSR